MTTKPDNAPVLDEAGLKAAATEFRWQLSSTCYPRTMEGWSLAAAKGIVSAYLRATTAGEPVAYEKCAWCNGSGLALNDAGEPDRCPDCKGDTVTPSEGTTPPPPVAEVVERLRILADVITMGEHIQWGSDSAAMNEAADLLEATARQLQAAEARAARLAGALKGLITWIEDEVGVDLPFDARAALGTTETGEDG